MARRADPNDGYIAWDEPRHGRLSGTRGLPTIGPTDPGRRTMHGGRFERPEQREWQTCGSNRQREARQAFATRPDCGRGGAGGDVVALVYRGGPQAPTATSQSVPAIRRARQLSPRPRSRPSATRVQGSPSSIPAIRPPSPSASPQPRPPATACTATPGRSLASMARPRAATPRSRGCSARRQAARACSVCRHPAVGIQGLAENAYGVSGSSSTQAGVWGSSSSNVGLLGTSTSGDGMYGSSQSGNGVTGVSTSGIGVYGSSPNGSAGRFDGNVLINGVLTVTGRSRRPWPYRTSTALYVGCTCRRARTRSTKTSVWGASSMASGSSASIPSSRRSSRRIPTTCS